MEFRPLSTFPQNKHSASRCAEFSKREFREFRQTSLQKRLNSQP